MTLTEACEDRSRSVGRVLRGIGSPSLRYDLQSESGLQVCLSLAGFALQPNGNRIGLLADLEVAAEFENQLLGRRCSGCIRLAVHSTNALTVTLELNPKGTRSRDCEPAH